MRHLNPTMSTSVAHTVHYMTPYIAAGLHAVHHAYHTSTSPPPARGEHKPEPCTLETPKPAPPKPCTCQALNPEPAIHPHLPSPKPPPSWSLPLKPSTYAPTRTLQEPPKVLVRPLLLHLQGRQLLQRRLRAALAALLLAARVAHPLYP